MPAETFSILFGIEEKDMIKNAVINLVSLIVVLMTIVINFFVISFMITFFGGVGSGFGIFPDPTAFHKNYLPAFIPIKYDLLIDTIIVLISLLIIGFTPIGRALLRWSYNFKKPKPEEYVRLQRILAPIFSAAGKDCAKYKIYIAEQNFQNAYAFGWDEIAVTRPTLDWSDYEIQGLLSHELGHLNYSDGTWSLIINIFNMATIISLRILFAFNAILCGIARIPIIGIPAAVMSWILAIFSWIVVFLQLFPQRIGVILNREVEYRADSYAVDIGFGENLIAAFHKLETVKKPSWWKRLKGFLNSTHPPTYYRIKKLQATMNMKDLAEQKQVPLMN